MDKPRPTKKKRVKSNNVVPPPPSPTVLTGQFNPAYRYISEQYQETVKISYTIPAGGYIFADPSYFLPERVFDMFVADLNKTRNTYEDKVIGGVYCIEEKLRPEIAAASDDQNVKKYWFWVHPSRFGDGVFTDVTVPNMYGVDVGMLALMPYEQVVTLQTSKHLCNRDDFMGIKLSAYDNYKNDLVGRHVVLDNNGVVSYDNGVFTISQYKEDGTLDVIVTLDTKDYGSPERNKEIAEDRKKCVVKNPKHAAEQQLCAILSAIVLRSVLCPHFDK